MAVQLAQGVLKSRENTSSPWENIMVEVAPNNDTNTLAAGFAADYDSTHTYNTDDLCTYEGGFYKCRTDGVSGTWNSTRWEHIDLDTIKNNIENIIGDGQLDESFTAEDLTGAVNELKDTLDAVEEKVGSDPLETTAQDLSGGVNELKTSLNQLGTSLSTVEKDLYTGGTAIPANSNLDNYKTPGKYYCINAATAATLTNTPFSAGFTIEVVIDGYNWIHQEAAQASMLYKKERVCNPDTNTWSDWESMNITVDKAILSGDNLNNYQGPGKGGIYRIRTGVTNSPVEWGSLVVMPGTSAWEGTTQAIFKGDDIYTRQYSGDPLAWTSWTSLFRMVKSSVNTGVFNIGANTGVTKRIPFTIPSGWTYFAINRATCNSSTVNIGNCYIEGSEFVIAAMNFDSIAKDIVLYVEYFYTKG